MTLSLEQKRALIEPDAEVSIRRQWDLLEVSRSSLYCEAVPESAENLALMSLLDREYTEPPFYGSRRMTE